jgi:RimJ/RimL family protein N-acetyltransferase
MSVPASLARVEGPNLTLRLIRPEDADYVYALRTDPAYKQHLSEVRGTAEDQRRWIYGYKAREADLRELYYVIERMDGTRCGLVRLYDIGAESFTWGSWILDHNKTRKAALESAVLIYVAAFERLELPKAEFDVRRDNTNTLAFHRRFGATETHETDQDIYFTYPRSRFEADRAGYLAILEKERVR